MRKLKSSLAGQWYSDDAAKLSKELDEYISNVPDGEHLDNVRALILPHAGYQYSGQVAAYGIKQIMGKSYKRVIIMGPTHRVQLPGLVSIPDVDSIETPLGLVKLDRDFIAEIMEYDIVQSLDVVHESEHSVQIELPILQHALGNLKIVPIVVGQLDYPSLMSMAYILDTHTDDETLVVVSSDFTHYGHAFGYQPFKDNIEKKLRELDMGAFEFIKQKDTDGFLDYIERTGATICGRFPLAILAETLKDKDEVYLLDYKTSGHISGDWSHCVSYVSAAVAGGCESPKQTV